jgi:hypothetical protein
MIGDVRLTEEREGVAGDVYILDAEVLGPSLLAKLSPATVKKFMICIQVSPTCCDMSLPYGLHIRGTNHNSPRGPSAGWWVLMTTNAAETKGLTCIPKQGGARDNKMFGLVTYLGQNKRIAILSFFHGCCKR